MLQWTRAKLDQPGVGGTGGSFEPYRELLAALDRYHTFAKRDPDDAGLVSSLRQIVHWAGRQLDGYPTETRNAAVSEVRGAASDEVGRLLLANVERTGQQLRTAPSYQVAEAVLAAADDYLAEFDTTPEAGQVSNVREEALRYKHDNNLFVNTGSSKEHNLSSERNFYTHPRSAVPADVNCALCTAAAVVTAVTGTLVTTDAIVRQLHPLPALSGPATSALGDLDYAVVYQHPESFFRIGRTLQGGSSMADLPRIVAVNIKAAEGIKTAVRQYGVSVLGGQSPSMRVAEAKSEMMLPRYQGCVFAVLVESAGHWNLARRTRDGVLFVDYQTDHVDRHGPQTGANPQMGVKPAGQRDLGEQHDVTFLAFTR